MADGQTGQTGQTGKYLLWRAGALVAAVIAVAVGVLLGVFVGLWIVDRAHPKYLRWIVGGASVFALAIPFAKDWLISSFDLVQNIALGKDYKAPIERAIAGLTVASFLATVSLAVFVASFLRAETHPVPTTCEELAARADGASAVAPPALVAKCLLHASDEVKDELAQLRTATGGVEQAVAGIHARVAPCPLLFENAGLNRRPEHLDGRGVCPEPVHMARLRETAAYLAAQCAESLRLRVTGYYSDAPFANARHSDALNEQAARLRAATAGAVLRVLLDDLNATAEIELVHRRRDESATPPAFADAAALAREDRWLISRSVVIEVLTPASCSAAARRRTAEESSRAADAAQPEQ